jgi:hypothetical protein
MGFGAFLAITFSYGNAGPADGLDPTGKAIRLELLFPNNEQKL